MTEYKKPILTIAYFEQQDVITTSGGGGGEKADNLGAEMWG